MVAGATVCKPTMGLQHEEEHDSVAGKRPSELVAMVPLDVVLDLRRLDVVVEGALGALHEGIGACGEKALGHCEGVDSSAAVGCVCVCRSGGDSEGEIRSQ